MGHVSFYVFVDDNNNRITGSVWAPGWAPTLAQPRIATVWHFHDEMTIWKIMLSWYAVLDNISYSDVY